MLKANEIIILSYINKYHRVDLYDIQRTVNAPLVQLANYVSKLYENGYIVYEEDEKFDVTDKAKSECISSWNQWTLQYKKKQERKEKNEVILNDFGIPVIENVKQLISILKLNEIDIRAYHQFELYSGSKVRTITAPGAQLKERQKWILHNILDKVRVEECVHGFVKEKSIKTNAECHLNKKEVLCLDIQDFFPSINGDMVKNVYLNLQYPAEVSQLLMELSTYCGVLPQGAPTSPMLANIVFTPVDKKLAEFAEENNLVYTRYADDLTFSADFEIEPLLNGIESIIGRAGFNINSNKTHIMKDNYRKMITGLVVKHDVRIPAAFKKKLRQEIYYCNKYGVSQHLHAIGRDSAVNFREYLYGKAYYVKMVEKECGEKFLQQLDEIFSVY